MDWFAFATQDYEVYNNEDRIKQFVINGKISSEEYKIITGNIYEASTN
ncbi:MULTISPECIES: XkdX family protein [Pontibacillus]|uniref:XkdX family protein n=1 Tax=Pontibacillus chungwhensis TaxID=265426 RepID=A0ABY8V2E4_9BACI|nr:XkdX family protein [Pontibacillus chungwhensis]MCD5324795.1 XkdX family protein [Pontibacillus sp. HN14]WIF98754.1 XkdX family protein [Pontibacillus chungwhensis]